MLVIKLTPLGEIQYKSEKCLQLYFHSSGIIHTTCEMYSPPLPDFLLLVLVDLDPSEGGSWEDAHDPMLYFNQANSWCV